MTATFCLLLVTVGPVAAQTPVELAKQAGVDSGLCVAAGVSDAEGLEALAANGRMLVQALVQDEQALTALRKAIAPERYGLVSAISLPTDGRLPYSTNLVNLLIVDADSLGRAAPSDAEIARVVAPLGATAIKRGGKWQIQRVPMPETMDEWTHWDHGPDGNPVSYDKELQPADAVQWMAPPLNSSGGRAPLSPTLRLSGGHLAFVGEYDRFDVPHRSGNREYTEMTVRDAFNGLPRWYRQVEQKSIGETAVIDGDEYFDAPNHKPGEYIAKIDCRTGKTLLTYDKGLVYGEHSRSRLGDDAYQYRHHPEVILHQRLTDRTLIQVAPRNVVVLDRDTGEVIWKKKIEGDRALTFAITDSSGEKLFLHYGYADEVRKHNPLAILMVTVDLSKIEAYAVKDGKHLWTNEIVDPKLRAKTVRSIYHNGSVFGFYQEGDRRDRHSCKVFAIDAQTGETLWRTPDYVRVSSTPMGKFNPLAFGGKLFIAERGAVIIDPQTGKALATQGYDIGISAGCQWGFALASGYLLSGPIFQKVEGNEFTEGFTPWAYRTGCNAATFPAFGMMYSPSGGFHSHNFLNGVSAWFDADESRKASVPDQQRLVRGPAWPAELTDDRVSPEQQWSVHMGSAQRHCSTSDAIGQKLEIAWQTKLVDPASLPIGVIPDEWQRYELSMGLLSAPTGAGERLFVALPERHQLAALDARSGEPQWTFTADGRVQAPPTLHRGLLYFGGQDGWAYCLRAADGQLVWKFFAARNEQRIVTGGQLESVWPVLGSPVIHQGQLVVNAGRHTTAEGGIRLYGLDPLRGAIQWQSTLDSVPLSIRDDAKKGKSPYKLRNEFPMFRNTLLVSNGENLHIGQWRLPNGSPEKANFPGQSIPDAEQNYICPNQLGFLCRREYSEGGQVPETYLRQLRYSRVEGGSIAIQDNVIVTSTVEKSSSTRAGGDFVEGIRTQRINPDGTARRPIYEPAHKRGDQPLPQPVLFDLSSYELGRTDAADAVPPGASAMAIAGSTIVLACKDQTLRLHGLRDGKPSAQIELPGVVVRDGIAIFGSKIYLTLTNGTVLGVTTR